MTNFLTIIVFDYTKVMYHSVQTILALIFLLIKLISLSCVDSNGWNEAFLLILSLIILMAIFLFVLPSFYEKL